MIGYQAHGELMDRLWFIDDIGLREACKSILAHPDFPLSVGSAGKHHCYMGGLAAHTLEVVDYARKMATMFPAASTDVVITSAVFHDFMKIREYEPIFETDRPNEGDRMIGVQKTTYRKLVRHVAGSHAEFLKAIDAYEKTGQTVDKDLVMRIEHAILTHHGRFEFGSPVEPQIVEAHILNFADQYSALYGPTRFRS